MPDPPMVQDPALRKLVNLLGAARAETLIREVLLSLGLSELRTPDDRFAFGCALIARGGVLEAVGRAVKIQAILHGASER